LQYARKAGAAEIRHTDDAQPGRGIFVDRVDRDNIGVLQLGQGLRLIASDRRDFDDDWPPGQRVLASTEHSRKRTASQFSNKPEAENFIADLGERQGETAADAISRQGAKEGLVLPKPGYGIPTAWEAPVILLGGHLLAVSAALTIIDK
jgi:hypothetical protein